MFYQMIIMIYQQSSLSSTKDPFKDLLNASLFLEKKKKITWYFLSQIYVIH